MAGRVDLARFGVAATTMRNMGVSYQGGAFSRAGSKFVGFSKQTGRNYPPRLITFQFKVNQGLALEFGNFYMRVIQNGEFVTEAPVTILGATQANPCVITVPATTGATSATTNTGAVATSYAPGELVTLAGGTFTIATVMRVVDTFLKSVGVNDPGTGYAGGNTVNLAGGTQTTTAVVTVVTTKVVGLPTISNPGAGGTPGPAVVTGTTGTGTKFQATVTIDGGGVIISVDSLTVAGSYTVNPTASDPVTGGGLAGAELNVVLGIEAIGLTTPGVFTVNSGGGAFSQGATSGSGTGATFRNGIFAPNTVLVDVAGRYSAYPANPVAQASSSGAGTGVTFTVTSGPVSPFAADDWVEIDAVQGMTQLNGGTYVVANPTATTFELNDVYGNTINSTVYDAYVGGGAASRIYTLETPYAEQDLPYLKFTESNDDMSLCLVNQMTLTEYAPLDLVRNDNDDWELLPVTGESTIEPPATLTGAASSSGSTNYQYVVTAVNPDDGTESVASPIANIRNAVNIAGTAGSITLTWSAVDGVQQYRVYKATPGFGAAVPVGALFGFAGSAYGTQFIDSNIIADFSQVPPTHKDPFARGQIIGTRISAGGAAYTTITLTVNSTTGSGADLIPVIVSGGLSAVIVNDAGRGYVSGDTVTVSGDGAGAALTLMLGPQTGTYPGDPAYFQQRRVYGNTTNRPNTYFMSQPGSYTNFDSRIPTIDTDAIIGNPWATQVNGIQQMLQMPGGLVVLSGLAAWQLTGTGGSSFNPQPITPSSQDAQPQAFNGCHDNMPAIKIDYDILYVQQKGSIVRNFSYQYYQNIYTGADLTLNCSHLFTNYELLEWAWCEEPFKQAWAVRDDGVMLSLTYVKPQEVAGWARHDTQGLYKSVTSVTEPPVDALYMAVQRFPGENTCYTIERADNRLWNTVEEAWCVDCALQLPKPTPDATLTASSAKGLGAISGTTGLVGGTGYSAATTARVVDDNGKGSGTGAILSVTVVSGVITAIGVSVAGTGYTYPAIVIEDPANSGSGASAVATLDNTATYTTTGAVFLPGDVGSVIRIGGGIATITARNSTRNVTVNITSPIVKYIPNTTTPQPAFSGDWTMTAPVSSIGGLGHLAGAYVTGLYDGKVLPATLVPASGIIDLPSAASAVVIGLGFTAQLQSTDLNPPGVTAAGQRKIIEAATVRLKASRGVTVGTNQPNGPALSPPELAPQWVGMKAAPDLGRPAYGSDLIPLYTGDAYVAVTGGAATPGQVAVEQTNPLPLSVLTFVPVVLPGDEPEDDPKAQKGQR